METALVKINEAKKALAEARDLHSILEIRDRAAAIYTYTIAKGAGEAANVAKEIQLRAERQAGEFLRGMEKNKGQLSRGCMMQPRGDIPTLAELGIEKTQSSRWQTAAELPEEDFEQYVAETMQDGKELTSAAVLRRAKEYKGKAHTMDIMGSSESPEWYTPQHIIDLTLELFGGMIDTDPCSNSKTSPIVPATHIYTKESNGLVQSWHGAVYMNPPYGTEIPKWIKALVHKYEAGEIQEAIALLPGRIDTQWFQPLYDYPICAIEGRLQFVGSLHSAPFPSVVIYLGDKRAEFIRIFSTIGTILERAR